MPHPVFISYIFRASHYMYFCSSARASNLLHTRTARKQLIGLIGAASLLLFFSLHSATHTRLPTPSLPKLTKIKMSEPDQRYNNSEAVLDSNASEISFLRHVHQDKCVFCQFIIIIIIFSIGIPQRQRA